MVDSLKSKILQNVKFKFSLYDFPCLYSAHINRLRISIYTIFYNTWKAEQGTNHYEEVSQNCRIKFFHLRLCSQGSRIYIYAEILIKDGCLFKVK